MEGSQDREGRGVSRPCAYAGGDSTKTVGIKFHGILEGKEQYDAVRTVWGTEIQVSEPGILAPGILRGYGGQECKSHSVIHSEQTQGR